MSPDIEALTLKTRAFAQARDWSQFHSPKNLACALSVEASELLELFQWLTDEQSRTLPEDKRQAAAGEVADVLLYLVQLCDALGIDPVQAAHDKLAANERRYPAELARGTSRKYSEL